MNTKNIGKIVKVSGPLVIAKDLPNIQMYEVVKVSEKKLMGEVIALNDDRVSIQVYEETSGIGPGEPVYPMGETMSVDLGPGLLTSIYDGVQRPLSLIEEKSDSHFIERGIDVPKINRDIEWEFEPIVKENDEVIAGDILGEVQETTLIKHKVMVPYGIKGKVISIKKGKFKIEDIIATVKDEKGIEKSISMLQKWPIRIPRPYNKKRVPTIPLISGTRILDTLFPIVKGGAGCIPGPFGAGKTVTQQTLAKFCDAEIIVYIGCGERGNEMTDVLMEFPHLKDPNTGEPLMKRTILIANTSNMPVAAREASIYTGVTIAEYYRDMGYNVALMADSTSRWAEALREMSGRLEEMPGEEGYPAYLGSKTAGFYERSGYVECLGSKDREGSLTLIGAVSPPGGDLSEPVTQNTLRTTKVFWGLDATLARRRHFPAINWLTSYSLYLNNVKEYWSKNISPEFPEIRDRAMRILQDEAKLEEIVRLVGMDALSNKEKLLLTIAKSIREDFLFQNAFDDVDAYIVLQKQYLMLKTILMVYDKCESLVSEENFEFDLITKSSIWDKINGMKAIKNDKLSKFDDLNKEISNIIDKLN